MHGEPWMALDLECPHIQTFQVDNDYSLTLFTICICLRRHGSLEGGDLASKRLRYQGCCCYQVELQKILADQEGAKAGTLNQELQGSPSCSIRLRKCELCKAFGALVAAVGSEESGISTHKMLQDPAALARSMAQRTSRS